MQNGIHDRKEKKAPELRFQLRENDRLYRVRFIVSDRLSARVREVLNETRCGSIMASHE